MKKQASERRLWHSSEPGPGSFRSIFKWGEKDRFKYPSDGFLKVIQDVASAAGYHSPDIGVYLQPKQNGRAFHMEASFPYNPEDPAEMELAETVYNQVSEALVAKGAFFYRIYGPWADMVYPRTGTLHETLKRIKRTLDPNSILNPGKLGF